MIKKLDHVAIAVTSVDETAKFYEGKLGLKMAAKQHVPERKVHVGFVPVGETRLELVEPDSPESPIARFLEKKGPGLQHICFEVDDCAAELAKLAAAGVKLIDQTPQVGAHGAKVGFIHPSATGGVLIELSEPARK